MQGISVIDNIGLESLSGLENIQIASDGNLTIEGNDVLTNLDALNGNVPSVLNTFRLSPRFPPCADICNPPIPPVYQPFTDLSFLSTVNEIFFLRLRGFQGDSLNGIQNIQTASSISVWECPNVTDLTSMSSVGGNLISLFVDSNEQLISLSGLDGVSSISNNLIVSNNEILTDFCALTTSVSNQVPDTFFISNNAYNPTIQDFLDGNCSE